jgi:GGDEF domain-containing protein
MVSPISKRLRVDRLIRCQNLLGFLETCLGLPVPDPLGNIPMAAEISEYFTILFVDMNGIAFLNETKGHSHGDLAIHWMGILLGKETNNMMYRLGGDEFAALLKMDSRKQCAQFMERINERMIGESQGRSSCPGNP